MRVKAFVDPWWDGWSWLNRREIQGDLEPIRRFSGRARDVAKGEVICLPVTCKMAARIQPSHFFLSFQRACAEARLCEEGAGEFDERRWKI